MHTRAIHASDPPSTASGTGGSGWRHLRRPSQTARPGRARARWGQGKSGAGGKGLHEGPGQGPAPCIRRDRGGMEPPSLPPRRLPAQEMYPWKASPSPTDSFQPPRTVHKQRCPAYLGLRDDLVGNLAQRVCRSLVLPQSCVDVYHEVVEVHAQDLRALLRWSRGVRAGGGWQQCWGGTNRGAFHGAAGTCCPPTYGAAQPGTTLTSRTDPPPHPHPPRLMACLPGTLAGPQRQRCP